MHAIGVSYWLYAKQYQQSNLSKGVTINNKTEQLFVYGIFLSEHNRREFKMTDPQYATVKDYATFGNQIVQAQYIPDVGFSLTGLVVDIPSDQWEGLDRLEGGYQRKRVTTTDGQNVWIYTA